MKGKTEKKMGRGGDTMKMGRGGDTMKMGRGGMSKMARGKLVKKGKK